MVLKVCYPGNTEAELIEAKRNYINHLNEVNKIFEALTNELEKEKQTIANMSSCR